MRKISPLVKGGVVTGAAFAAAIGLAISPASAAGTWTVTGGGSFTGTSTNTVLKDTVTGTTLTCKTSTATGSAANTTGASGTGIGSIATVSWSSCSGPLGITFTVTADGLPWALNAVSYSGGVTTGTLTGVKAHISGLGCTATFAGATSTTAATLNVSYTNSTHDLKVLGTGNLHAYNVSGTCLGLINTGDATTYSGDYGLSPATLAITSP
ncbi:hypothetical protein RVR_2555 [Actinacidiphila reveromycinica]|uniref:Uncharacterized protein n=1 Tax=Actinacidiphila reveromycinica TaxID=659352 RepID=A0A7U3UQM6_9ACTN|nr:hypothetical protein [Streptomyces sp. SN-593]BBA97007.1 hypothetical protein RVR_2555 [Streptomyces sp. SN-593]